MKCQNCEKQLVYEERVGELVPTGVEFLNSCYFTDEERKNNVAEDGYA